MIKTLAKCVCAFFAIILIAACSTNPPNSALLRTNNTDQDIEWIAESLPPEEHKLTLCEAIDMALERNLELYVKQLEWEIQSEIYLREQLLMIPNFRFTGEKDGRNNDPGVTTALPAQETRIRSWDTTIILNLLDFGISYFKSRQEALKGVIAAFAWEKARQKLIMDVSVYFWQVSVSQLAIDTANRHIERLDRLIAIMERKKWLFQATIVYSREVELMRVKLQLQEFKKQKVQAMADLKEKLGLPPCYNLELESTGLPSIMADIGPVETLEELALFNRPELYSQDMDERLQVEEARLAYWGMFPPLQLFAGEFHNRDKYLINKRWLQAGFRIIWDLIALPQRAMDYRVAKDRRIGSKATRLYMSIGVLGQVNLSYEMFLYQHERYKLIHQMNDIQQKRLVAAGKERHYGSISELELIIFENEAVRTELETLSAWIEVQTAMQHLNLAIGVPEYFQVSPPTPGPAEAAEKESS